MLESNICNRRFAGLSPMLSKRPEAIAVIRGSAAHPQIDGVVRLYQTEKGVLVAAEITGLPTVSDVCKGLIFAFHIHAGGGCSGNAEDPFADALAHYNPAECQHPYHAGDLPPLFGNNGYALSVFLTDRFTVDDVIGRVFIIHAEPDDFHSQPAGHAGMKIACGVIQRC